MFLIERPESLDGITQRAGCCMSTTLDRRKARKQKTYAEFDEYISYQLSKTQTGIRSTDIFTALCGAAVFVISYLLVFVVLDHWVVTGGFGNGMRAVLLVGLIIGTLAWVGWKVVWPFFRRVNALYAAQALEEASPELKSTLLNYVDLRSANREVAPAIISSMEKRAAVTLSHAEVDDAIDRSTLLRLSYALLAAVVLFSVYSVVSPKKVWPSIIRIFAPGSDVSVSTQTAFLSVDPGDTKVLAREFLTVTTDLSGEVPEDVTLLYTTADQQFVDEAVPMREVEAGLKRYRCILKGNGGEGLLQGLSYRIVAGDASTKTYNVTVAQPPSATVDELRYSFPDYMELPLERPTGSNIDTWEGTKIEIAATVNMAVESAKLQFSDEAEFPARCEEIRMKVGGGGTTVTGLWQPIIREDGTYPQFYRVQCRTKDGATDPTPAVHSIQIRPDEKPDVSTLQPRGDMEVAANATVPLLINASDPDFRLSRVVLQIKNGTQTLTPRVIYTGADVEQRVLHELDIAGLNAKPGDVITWWAEAHDNRRVETASRTLLDANRSSTPRLKFIVQAPVSEEEAKEQLERDKERAQEKLDELDQRAGDDDLSSDGSNNDMPDRGSDSGEDPPSDADNQKPNSDEPESQEKSSTEQNSDGDEGKAGGKGGSDSDSNSNGEGGKETGDETGKSDSDKTKPGQEGTDSENTDGAPKQDGSKGESGRQKPVSNDGSQDDEILKELLNRNRDSNPDGSKGEGAKKDNDNQTSGDGSNGEKPNSPESKTGDEESSSESSKSEGDTAKGRNKPDEPREESANEKPDADAPEDGMPNGSEKQPGEGNAPKKGDEKKGSPDSKDATEDGDDPPPKSEPGKAEPGSKPVDPKKSDDGGAGQDNGASGDKKPSDPSAMPKSDMPKSDMPSSGDSPDGESSPTGDSPSKPTDDPAGTGKSGEPGKISDDDGGKSSPPGQTNKSGQPGKPSIDSSEGQGGGSSDSSPSDKGSAGQPSSKDGSKGSGGEQSSDQSPGGDASKSSSQESGKAGGDPSTDKPASEKSGDTPSGDPKDSDVSKSDKPNGSKSGEETGNESSDKGGAEKSGGAESGKSGKSDTPGKPGGKPGEGGSGGSTINDGASGSGKSNAKSGKPGQSTGSKPSSSSDPGGEAVASPDDNADPDKAVQRENSGANPVDPNLKDADEANLEDKLKASNMVLKRLKEELDRGDVDPELLKKLGWTEKDMQRFAERLERQLAQPKPNDPAAEARRRQFEEVLRNVDLESYGREQSGDFGNQKSTNNFSERRLPAPRSHRKAYEDYLKKLSQQRRRSGTRESRE
jgi:collagen type III alpha